jgi:hypothetical protein
MLDCLSPTSNHASRDESDVEVDHGAMPGLATGLASVYSR